jgi:hypothetical protein
MTNNVIDLGASLLKYKADLEDREKVIQVQQQHIAQLQEQLASISATNDMLKLLLMDIISISKQRAEQDGSYVQQLQDLLHKLPHIAAK